VGPTRSLVDILALTQVFERRVYRHFLDHARIPGTHPVVRRTLLRMVEEEESHLSWVKRWLDAQAETRPDEGLDALTRYAKVDEEVYAELLREFYFDVAA